MRVHKLYVDNAKVKAMGYPYCWALCDSKVTCKKCLKIMAKEAK